MESKQLVDALTDHIAFYHSSSFSNPNPNPNPRNPLLRWLSSLSPADRQQTLTLIDPNFVRVLLQMRSRLDCNGHGSFFLLPDLPSSSDPSLPSLCFRRSRGLLSRAGNPRDLLVSESLLLFGSRSEEELDSVTVDEAFVSDVDRFVEVMDGVSNGRFLRGEEKGQELEKEWAELEWLKDKGYYSLEAFLANRLEVALRLAWRASGRGGRKGKGGGGGSSGNGVSASVSVSALWRKKGCVDWWARLDSKRREEICTGFLGKTAKCLANDIVKVPSIASRNIFSFLNIDGEMPLKFGPNTSGQTPEMFLKRDSDFCLDLTPSSGMPHYFAKLLNKLLVVQEISAILLACQLNRVEKEKLFFSRLGAAFTVADLIMRKLRGVIMAVSIEHVNQELMGDEKLKTLPLKAEEKKLNVSYRKGKKKSRNSKRLNSLPKPSKVNSTWEEPSMNSECKSDHLKDRSLCHQVDTLSLTDGQKKGIFNESVLPKDRGKGHAVDLLDYKGHVDKKKNEGKKAKSKKSSSKEVVIPNKNKKTIIPSVSADTKKAECVELADTLMTQPISSDLAVEDGLSPILGCCNVSDEVVASIEKMKDCAEVDYPPCFADKCSTGKDCSPISNELENGVISHVVPCVSNDERSKQTISSCPSVTSSTVIIDKQLDITCSRSTPCCDNTGLPLPTWEIENAIVQNENEHPIFTGQRTLLSILPEPSHAPVKENAAGIQSDHSRRYIYNHLSPMGGMSYEWPNITPSTLTCVSSMHLPATTDRLHLEVGHKCQNHFHQSLLSRHQARNSSVEGGQSRILPSLIPMSYDWPPMVKKCGRLSQTATVSYDSAFNPPLRPSFCSGFAAHAGHGVQVNGVANESEKKESGDSFDLYDMKSASELVDDPEGYWLSEEETETHAVFGRDYNQFFGGGVMYWNPAEHVAGFSRPPSHSSEDSSWAWYEADLNRAIDDMVGMPGLPTSYNTTGLASPPAAPFCSPFDPLGSAHQQIGYPLSGNDGGNVLHSSSPEENAAISLNNSPGGVEGAKADLLPYARLRPIIAPSVSRNGSRSEFKLSHGHKSPCLPSTRRDHPRIKRPPSPVVLCVPRVPRPPPPSPVGETRKRGFPIVRSGSSSPRHWGMRSRSNEDGNCEDPRLCLEGVEVVWPSWGAKGLVGTPVAQSVQGSLLQDHLITISQLTHDQEHPDIALPVQPPDILNSPHKASLSLMHNILHEEIDFFCKQVAAENMIRKPYINWAIKRVARSLQVLWPRSRTNIFGSNATGLALPTSDVDLVVSLPPVRNLEPIKEAGILEGRNGIKETCLQHAARYLANQEWVRNDSLKTIENTAIPVIMLVTEVPHDIICSNGASSIGETPEVRPTLIPKADAPSHPSTDHASLPICTKNGKDVASSVTSIRLDISFKSTSHTGLQTSELVRELTQQFPASVPLALVLKIFLADRNLDHAYSGGLSSYCLVLLIIRFLQHEHHMGRPINHNLGSLLMDFLYFFGNVFDPRQMRISIQGSGVYVKRERGLSIDPIHIDDPLFPSNNVGRNCFRIHQCIKAFADAYSLLENELSHFSSNYAPNLKAEFTLLQKIIPSIDRG